MKFLARLLVAALALAVSVPTAFAQTQGGEDFGVGQETGIDGPRGGGRGDDVDDDDKFRFPPPRRTTPTPPPVIIFEAVPVQPAAPPRRRVAAPPPPPPPPPPLPDNAPDEIVALDLSEADLAAVLARGFEVIEQVTIPGLNIVTHRLRIPGDQTLVEARDFVRALPTGGTADFNHYYRTIQGSACGAAPCPERTLIGWPGASARDAACGLGAEIGMIDSGINDRHETFTGAELELVRLPPDPEAPSAAVHGTAVAALLVGDPASRSPGLVPGARLVAVDAFYRAGRDERADTFTLLEALGLVTERGARVLNLSFAGPDNTALATVIGQLTLQLDVLVVAAVGNSGPDADPEYPAGYDPVLAVTAVDRTGALYARAVRGDHVDIAAPGVEVWTAASVKGARWKTGTSFAAPFVSAAAAILRATRPEMTAAEIADELRRQARDLGEPGPDPDYGAGLLTFAGLCEPAP